MSFDTLKRQFGREPITVVEIDLDFCTRTYGTSPCTAGIGVTGSQKCFNTRKTCQDPNNYNVAPKTYRFCTPTSKLPIGENIFPVILDVKTAPTQIKPTGLSERATITITLQDFPHHDGGVDPYVADRSYTPNEQGTFFGKLIARNPYVYNRALRLKTGYIGDTFDTTFNTDFQTRLYFIDKIEAGDASGRVRIVAKDILKLANNDRSKAPFVSIGKLAADILSTDTTFSVNTDAGAGYPAGGGTLLIGDELMTYTSRTGDTFSGVTRGTDGTVADDHSLDDTVQLSLRYTSTPVQDILEDLLVTYAGVDGAYIPKTDWNAEAATWLSGYSFSAVIPKPTGVRKLIEEIIESSQLYLWWDELAQEVKLKAIAPPLPSTPPAVITDNDHILKDTLRVRELISERKSQVWVHFGVIDAAQDIKKENLKNISTTVDGSSESATQNGTTEIKTITSRWIPSEAIAEELEGRYLSRFRDAPKEIEFELDAKDNDLNAGDFVDVQTRLIQDFYGAKAGTRFIVTESSEAEKGTRYKYRALEFQQTGRLGLIAPDALLDYTAESEANKALYAFIAADTGLMSDGSRGYVIS